MVKIKSMKIGVGFFFVFFSSYFMLSIQKDIHVIWYSEREQL